MKESIKTGLSFGLTSGIITTLGLMVGLNAGTHSTLAVAGGVITIAIADASSDALGIHISEEAENKHTAKQIWAATLATFIAKFLVSMTFILPIIFFQLSTAILISILWGLSILVLMSFELAKLQKIKPWRTISEHVAIAVVVIAISHGVGNWVSMTFH